MLGAGTVLKAEGRLRALGVGTSILRWRANWSGIRHRWNRLRCLRALGVRTSVLRFWKKNFARCRACFESSAVSLDTGDRDLLFPLMFCAWMLMDGSNTVYVVKLGSIPVRRVFGFGRGTGQGSVQFAKLRVLARAWGSGPPPSVFVSFVYRQGRLILN